MNFSMVSKKAFIKYDNVKKLYYELSNIVHLAANTCTSFIVIVKKPTVFALQKENVYCVNFAAYFLQAME